MFRKIRCDGDLEIFYTKQDLGALATKCHSLFFFYMGIAICAIFSINCSIHVAPSTVLGRHVRRVPTRHGHGLIPSAFVLGFPSCCGLNYFQEKKPCMSCQTQTCLRLGLVWIGRFFFENFKGIWFLLPPSQKECFRNSDILFDHSSYLKFLHKYYIFLLTLILSLEILYP